MLAFPKYRPGQSLAETRGKARKARAAYEREEKRKVRARDRRCRWPGCKCHTMRYRLECAHLENKGIGGDHGRRSSADQMILLCYPRHQGTRGSLHAEQAEVRPETAAGADGPVSFWLKDESGAWYCVARERAAFVYERD